MDSDAALEYDDQADALTVYFKSSGTILQESVSGPLAFGLYSFSAIDTTSPHAPLSVSAPRVIWGAGGDSPPEGIRTVITRGYNADTPANAQSATILVEADHHYDPFPPYQPNMPEDGGAACIDGVLARETFGNHVAGCAGSVTWDARGTLCGSGSRPCRASEWTAARGSAVPGHDYWTDDNLLYNGSGTGSCFVSTTVGNACTQGEPMRVCTPTGADPGYPDNICNWAQCGYGSNAPNQYFGGCNGNQYAGTLCCLSVAP